MRKKAQGGTNAAILVAIIAGLIILYIVFLPTPERERFIGDSGNVNGSSVLPSNLLLKASPGLLSVSQGLESEKGIPNVFLVETTNAKELDSINPFIAKNSWFSQKDKQADFDIQDLDNVDNVVLSFTAKKRSGVLAIKLNDAVVFENEVTKEIIEPVKLSKKLLRESNTLTFSVSSSGVKFWAPNEYSIENIKIIGDITDTSRQESSNVFTITDSEFSSMERANLRFTPYCSNVNELGTLNVFINSRKLFSTVPECDNVYRQSVPKSVLNEGENTIVFKASKGGYSVENIKVALEFKEPRIKTYYFEVDSGAFNKIKIGDAVLTIKFIDDGKQKRAKLDVNGRIETIETSKGTFSKSIASKLSQGNNYLRIEPLGDLEIVELKVEVV